MGLGQGRVDVGVKTVVSGQFFKRNKEQRAGDKANSFPVLVAKGKTGKG